MHNTLIVTDDVTPFGNTALTVLTFQDYLAEFPKLNEPKIRVINICDTTRYLSEGYYCSLLAQARNHSVLPSVNTINDLRMAEENSIDRIVFSLSVQQDAAEITHDPLFVLFGEVEDQRFKRLARQAFEKYPYPALVLTPTVTDIKVSPKATGKVQIEGFASVQAKAFKDLSITQQTRFITQLKAHPQIQWKMGKTSKRTRWDMAILVNPEETTPPSDERAIKNFVKAAEKAGFHADVVSRLSQEELGHFDALFIRETTAIDHHTYRLARAAEREGIVVMDDTQSILRCCNKVYLQDAFAYQKVPAPKATFVASANDDVCDELIADFGLPLVLKLPESSFSRGVHKAETKDALKTRLKQMLAESALVLVQEYIFTEFDWRIGVLGGKPIYACQYFMVRNHWQIYNHHGDRFSSGGFTTMPTFEVPKPVLQAAIKAAKAVGDGLYGVDIKQVGNAVYVIEVNDNPSIDAGVEDKYLGKALYELIMQEFANRLEQRGR